MKPIISIVLIIAILSNTLSIPLYYAYYKLNTAYIIEMFCINKEKKALKCNGKCHLAKVNKQLSKPQTEDSTPIPRFDERQFLQLFFKDNASEAPFFISDSVKKLPPYLDLYHFLYLSSTFHPPELLA